MAKPKLGSGARFKQLKGKLAAKGATNPSALAAYIGRKKYGTEKFAQLSAKGKKREPEKGETMKHEKGESKAFEAKEKDRKKRAPKQGNVPMSATKRVGPLAGQHKLVSPMSKLKVAMKRVAKHG